MIEETILVGLLLERIAPTSTWAEASWRPAAVFEPPPETPDWTIVAERGEVTQFYAGRYAIALYATDTANYLSNLAAGPRLWVVMRRTMNEPGIEVVAVTADPAEGEAFTEPGTDLVETLAMPAGIAARVAGFAEAHHQERPFFKRRRDSREMDQIGGAPRKPGGGGDAG